ncbi:hypothetical protein HYD74_01070 [Mycoplasmopsis bovis]|nr:hypothetical protein HYD74_01070 [Mycoplasmopsis bovis]
MQKGKDTIEVGLVRDIYNKIYKVTKYGDFIYSSNNLDRGSIGANKYGNACISPVYSIFKCTNSSDHNFIKNILSRHSFVNKLLKYRQGVVYGQLKIQWINIFKYKFKFAINFRTKQNREDFL